MKFAKISNAFGSFILDLTIDPKRHVHHDEHSRRKNGKSDLVMTEDLLENIEGIAFVGFHQEHKIRIQYEIEEVDRDRHTNKKRQTLRDILSARLYVTAEGDHNRIDRKQDMNGKAMQMHKIQKRKLRPRRKYERHQGCGNAYGIEILTEHAVGLDRMKRDQNNIDTAKMEREIIGIIITVSHKAYDLKKLVGKQQRRKDITHIASSLFRTLFINQGTSNRDYQECSQPKKMCVIEM